MKIETKNFSHLVLYYRTDAFERACYFSIKIQEAGYLGVILNMIEVITRYSQGKVEAEFPKVEQNIWKILFPFTRKQIKEGRSHSSMGN